MQQLTLEKKRRASLFSPFFFFSFLPSFSPVASSTEDRENAEVFAPKNEGTCPCPREFLKRAGSGAESVDGPVARERRTSPPPLPRETSRKRERERADVVGGCTVRGGGGDGDTGKRRDTAEKERV